MKATKLLLPWVPVLFVLEGVRIASDAVALRAICGASAEAMSLREWARLHLAANAALVVLPGGRAVSEGMKIARLRPLIGGGRAAAIVATLHVTTLLGIAIVSFAAALMAVSAPALSFGLAAHGAMCLALALSLRAALSRAKVPAVVNRWLGGAVVDDLRTESRALPFVPRTAMAAKLVNCGAQAIQFAIVLGSVSGGVLASGVTLLGGIVSDLSIASIGATDGAFALAAPALSLAVPSALVVAGVARLVSLSWSAIGALV
ncbi:MAG: hypothetical protein ACXVEE_05115 [Polyangiales bacterium]